MKSAASARAAGSVEGGGGVGGGEAGEPGGGVRRAGGGAGDGDGGVGPGVELLVHEREVEEPFAGVVDDVEVDDAGAGRLPIRPVGGCAARGGGWRWSACSRASGGRGR